MTRILAVVCLVLAISAGIFLVPKSAESYTFTHDNFDTLPHPLIASFGRDSEGVWRGFTTNGKSFTQYPVKNVYGLRIERFVIDDYSHYIVEGEIVYSLRDLSVHLALATQKPHV